MYIDASAIVAILTDEPEADALTRALEGARNPVSSATAIFEATAALCRKRHSPDVVAAHDVVMEFLAIVKATTVTIGEAEAKGALEAFAKFGKGRGHPAQLNMGDCFAYAVARSRDAPMLAKGGDFSQTDLLCVR